MYFKESIKVEAYIGEKDYEWALDRAAYVQNVLNTRKNLTQEEVDILETELNEMLNIVEEYESPNSPTWEHIKGLINNLDELKIMEGYIIESNEAKITEGIDITEDEIQARYDDYIKELAPESNISYDDFKTSYLRDTIIDGEHLNLVESDSTMMSSVDKAVQAIKVFDLADGSIDTDWLVNDIILNLKNEENLMNGVKNTRRPPHSPAYEALITTLNQVGNTKFTSSQVQAAFKKLNLDYKEILKPVVKEVEDERAEMLEEDLFSAPQAVYDDSKEKGLYSESVNTDTRTIIRTGLSDAKAHDVLKAVLGQLSDGIWENSPSMSKYWTFADIEKDGSEIVIKVDTESYDSAFYKKTEEEIKRFFATKIKQIVKDEGLTWTRDTDTKSSYLNYNSGVTVKDAYSVYDKLLGRKDRISESLDFSAAEYTKLNDIIKRVNNDYSVDKITMVRTPAGNWNIRTIDNKDIITISENAFTDNELEEFRLNGIIKTNLEEAKEYDIFKQLEKITDKGEIKDIDTKSKRDHTLPDGFVTDGLGNIFRLPEEGYSKVIKKDNKSFRYNYKTKELEWFKDDEVIEGGDIMTTLNNRKEAIERLIDKYTVLNDDNKVSSLTNELEIVNKKIDTYSDNSEPVYESRESDERDALKTISKKLVNTDSHDELRSLVDEINAMRTINKDLIYAAAKVMKDKGTASYRGKEISDMIIEFLEVDKKSKKTEEATKEYRYITNHGIGPGMMPSSGIRLIRSEDLPYGKTAIYVDRPFTQEELNKYDIKPEWIQESMKTESNDNLKDNNTFKKDLQEFIRANNDKYFVFLAKSKDINKIQNYIEPYEFIKIYTSNNIKGLDYETIDTQSKIRVIYEDDSVGEFYPVLFSNNSNGTMNKRDLTQLDLKAFRNNQDEFLNESIQSTSETMTKLKKLLPKDIDTTRIYITDTNDNGEMAVKDISTDKIITTIKSNDINKADLQELGMLKLSESKLTEAERYQLRKYDGEGSSNHPYGVFDTKSDKFVQKGTKKVMDAACNDLNKKEKKTEAKSEDNEYDYMLLDRLRTDCEYFLGNGNRSEKGLWAGNVEDHIGEMKKIYNKLAEKPEWLTMEEIESYEKQMKSNTKNESKLTEAMFIKVDRDEGIEEVQEYYLEATDEEAAQVVDTWNNHNDSINYNPPTLDYKTMREWLEASEYTGFPLEDMIYDEDEIVTEAAETPEERDARIFDELAKQQNNESVVDILQDKIGQQISVGEFNTSLQSVFALFEKTFLTVTSLLNMDPMEPQELAIVDDDDTYIITFNIIDQDKGILEITDVAML